MLVDKKKIYRSGDSIVDKRYFINSGEFRQPKKGEFFLSGAIVESYKAFNDLTISYWIAREVIIVEKPELVNVRLANKK